MLLNPIGAALVLLNPFNWPKLAKIALGVKNDNIDDETRDYGDIELQL